LGAGPRPNVEAARWCTALPTLSSCDAGSMLDLGLRVQFGLAGPACEVLWVWRRCRRFLLSALSNGMGAHALVENGHLVRPF
jgi:hypothetical protein